jgi:hypothetical protein
MQDVLVVTAPGSGAEIIPFLKTWVNLPAAIAFTVLYAQVRYGPHRIFEVKPWRHDLCRTRRCSCGVCATFASQLLDMHEKRCFVTPRMPMRRPISVECVLQASDRHDRKPARRTSHTYAALTIDLTCS